MTSHGEFPPKTYGAPTDMGQALSIDMDNRAVQEASTGAMHDVWGQERFAVDRIAENARVTRATAQNWWERRNAPQLAPFWRLFMSVPEYRDAFCRRLGVADVDPMKAQEEIEILRRRIDRLTESYDRFQEYRRGR